MDDKRSEDSPSWLEYFSRFFQEEPKDRASLLEMLRSAAQRNLLDGDTMLMLEGAMQVSEMQVRDVMIPRVGMQAIRCHANWSEISRIVSESHYSRFPAVADSLDDVVGILLAKDLLPYFVYEQQPPVSLEEIIRPVVFVPESKRLLVLLREFRQTRNHMAIVIDEYRNVSGLVTIEDVIEEIVGEIEDEHDTDEDEHIRPHGKDQHVVQALVPLDEFNRFFSAELKENGQDTLGGWVVTHLGHVPKRGERILLPHHELRVLRADQRRVLSLRVIRSRLELPEEED